MNKPTFFLGFEFAAGAILAIVLFTGVSNMIADWVTPRDDCDSAYERCGMRVLTDHRTGLQYLQGQEGGLIPRMDVSGQQIRRAAK